MISSSGVVFVAVLARIMLGTMHTAAQWGGILLATVGLGLVGAALLLEDSHGQHNGTAPALSGSLGAGAAAGMRMPAYYYADGGEAETDWSWGQMTPPPHP